FLSPSPWLECANCPIPEPGRPSFLEHVMAKLKMICSDAKLKKVVNALPADPNVEGEDFKALRGKKKGENSESVGIYIGSAMNTDYTADKAKLVSAQFFQGKVKRSAKDPVNRLVLVTTNAGKALTELARACLKEAKLKHKIVSVKPGEREPEQVDE